MLEAGDQGIPRISRLDFDDERRLVIVEREGKGTAFIPMERVSSMEPMAKGEEKQYELTPDADRQRIAVEKAREQQAMREKAAADKKAAAEERARQATNTNHVDAVKEADRIRLEYEKNHAPKPETTPFPAGKTPPQYVEEGRMVSADFGDAKTEEFVERGLDLPESGDLEDQANALKHKFDSKSKPPRKKRKYTKRKKKGEANV